MAVRIYLEIGHEASIRTKKTQEGFTHDWEVFVRGCDGAEIHYFIEKVVFHLHDTFPKPRRVIKEPPYVVKESGYAGFTLPIEIYLRNNNEPKKLKFAYDLHLQQTGPPILKVQKEKFVFNSPSDDFKIKLLKGGGSIGSSSAGIPEINDNRSSLDDKNQMTNKPKLGGCDLMKKQKMKTGEPCRDFQELFGSPITMTSKTSEPKGQSNKQEKSGDKSRTKHSPHKDSHKDKEKKDKSEEKKNKEEKKQKEKNRDRERSKDKSIKKEKSPRPKSPSPKRSPKRTISPSRFSSPPVTKHKHNDKERREKFDDNRKKEKKEKRNKEHKENKHGGEEQKTGTSEDHKARSSEIKKESKIKSESPTPKIIEKKEKPKEKSAVKDEKEKSHSEKYKHKKKDKEKRERKEEKYKFEKKPEKVPENKPVIKTEFSPKKEKISKILPNIDDDSSNSSTSSSNSSFVEKKIKSETIKIKEEKNVKTKKEKGYQDSAIKCKRKSGSVEVEEPPEKLQKEHNINNNSDTEDVKTVLSVKQDEEEDYFSVLRDLQHKIMGLKDNSDLQKVVKLIAETGRYEVSAHTFDFDLCLLDRSTVQQLQDFFANET